MSWRTPGEETAPQTPALPNSDVLVEAKMFVHCGAQRAGGTHGRVPTGTPGLAGPQLVTDLPADPREAACSGEKDMG